MAGVLELGTLVTSTLGLEIVPSLNFETIATAADTGNDDPEKVAEKAIADIKEAPSIWFVNFPTKESATTGSKELRSYMQDILDYRCWASGIWWKNVYNHPNMPKDSSMESINRRCAFAAKVAIRHMKDTPWLAMKTDHTISKQIRSKVTEFHLDLAKNVLEGFVGITPSVLKTIDGILTSLSKTVKHGSSTDSDTKMIVCEKYEYVPEGDFIVSSIRIISFSVSNDMKNVENTKKKQEEVKCTIEYNEYEASFNRKTWLEIAQSLSEAQKKAGAKFLKETTIDCDP